jgi:hypothetical protein
MWLLIKDNFRALYTTLAYGLVGILPALFFGGVLGGVLVLLGMEDKVDEMFFFIYAGACGGYWLGKKLTLIRIERMPDDLTKWDIRSKLEKD